MDQLLQSFPMIPSSLRLPFFGLALLAAITFVAGVWERASIWRLGVDRPVDALHGLGTLGFLRLAATKLFSADCLLARRVFARSRVRGVMVVLMIWGTLALAAGVAISAATYLLPWPLLPVGFVRGVELLLDVAGGLVLLGLAIALGRRYLFRPERWVSITADGAVLSMMFLVVLLAFIMEGLRLAQSGFPASDVWWRWPVGAATALALRWLGGGAPTSTSTSGTLYLAVYLVHGLLGFVLLAYLPYSKLFHLFAAQITTYVDGQERAEFEARRWAAAPESRLMEGSPVDR